MRHTRDERGMALAAAVFALVIIAALITGVFFAARQEMKIGENSLTAQRAFDAAEAGLDSTASNWNTSAWNVMATGDSATVSGALPSGVGSWSGTVRRLNDQQFIVRVTGQDPNALSSRTLGALMRLKFMTVNILGAVTTQGSMQIGGSSQIDGYDTNPSGWDCPPAGPPMPGIATKDTSLISTSGCGGYSCVAGSPQVQENTSINASTFQTFGDLTWAQVVAMATINLPGGYNGSNFGPIGTATTCNTSVQYNWGDPMSPPSVQGCQSYFPIIHVAGDFKATGGYGQGILLVDGNIDVQGGFQFFGPVIALGTLSTQGTGGHFNGGVMAANLNLGNDQILGNAVVTYSSCAVLKALRANTPAQRLGQRAWVDLF